MQARAAPLIRDVRGRGLWVGVDIDPAHGSARELVERLAQAGVLSKETHETVVRFAPPLTITTALVDRAMAIFTKVVLAKPGGFAINSGAPVNPGALEAA